MLSSEASAPAPLRFDLEVEVGNEAQPTIVSLSLWNISNEAVTFLDRQLPGDRHEPQIFDLVHDGRPLDFHGFSVTYGPVVESDSVTLYPGEALRRRYVLSKHYALNEPGLYTLSLRTNSLAAPWPGGRIEVESEPVTFELPTGEDLADLLTQEASPVPFNPLAVSTFNGCSQGRIDDVLEAHRKARWIVDLVLGEGGGRSQISPTNAYYSVWFGPWDSQRANGVRQIFSSIKSRFDSDAIKYDCDGSCGGAVKVYKPFPNSIHICSEFHGFNEITQVNSIIAGQALFIGLSPSDSLAHGEFAVEVHKALHPVHDVDGDGFSDLVTLRADTQSVYTYRGQASGVFQPATTSFGGTMNAGLRDGVGHVPLGVADVNGDLLADLVTLHSDGHIYTYFGRNSGDFSGNPVASSPVFDVVVPGTSSAEFVGLADVNGDRLADAVFLDGNRSIAVYLASGGGGFSASAVYSFNGTMPTAYLGGQGHYVIGVADVTGDRRADLITTAYGNVYVYPGTVLGQFLGSSSAGISFNGTYNLGIYDGSGHEPIGVSDVDADGFADLVSLYNGTIYVYPGNASGVFSYSSASFAGTMASSLFSPAGHEVIAAMDVDGNGTADLVTAHSDGNVRVYRGNLSRIFSGVTSSFNGTMNSSRHDGVGHEFAAEQRNLRRLGCAPGGC
ncbi:MAG: VCBS repeat-containing protein [Deltaproteobacteria bacterium]|nr:VCBS repeat-containing protein [Deltaproteobacteria bacterium]